MTALRRSDSGQARAPESVPLPADAFATSAGTRLWWLGMAGFLVNSRGTTLTIDAMLTGFDMPLMYDNPLAPEQVRDLDAFLVTHSDNDHCSLDSAEAVAGETASYHASHYVASLIAARGLPATGHDIGASFEVGAVRVRLTPADHAWQNAFPGTDDHVHAPEDACGFWIETPDGTIWHPGDSRLIEDHHLTMPSPDVILFDFSDSEWHMTLDGAVRFANAHPTSQLVLHHWGCVDAPEFTPFNGDPEELARRVDHPERLHVLAPGETFTLSR